MRILEHWGIFNVNQMSQQARLKAEAASANSQKDTQSKSHAKGQLLGIGIFFAVILLLLIYLLLI